MKEVFRWLVVPRKLKIWKFESTLCPLDATYLLYLYKLIIDFSGSYGYLYFFAGFLLCFAGKMMLRKELNNTDNTNVTVRMILLLLGMVLCIFSGR